jgi:hypothetical protein
MRKAFIILAAIVPIAFGALVALPRLVITTPGVASADTGMDIYGLTRKAQRLPEQSYPTH